MSLFGSLLGSSASGTDGSASPSGPTPGPTPPVGFFGSLFNGLGGGGGAGAGAGGLSSFFSPAAIAAAIGVGKNTEANHPNTMFGQGLLAGLGPSASQVASDPVGMGLPTALGAPFLTPFTSSKSSQATPPEWQGLFGFGF